MHEYDLLRKNWDTTRGPKYDGKKWSDDQEEALHIMSQGIGHED